jgi:ribosomal protein S27AE
MLYRDASSRNWITLSTRICSECGPLTVLANSREVSHFQMGTYYKSCASLLMRTVRYGSPCSLYICQVQQSSDLFLSWLWFTGVRFNAISSQDLIIWKLCHSSTLRSEGLYPECGSLSVMADSRYGVQFSIQTGHINCWSMNWTIVLSRNCAHKNYHL